MDKAGKRDARLFQRGRQWGESQSNGIIERAAGLVAGQARTPRAALEPSHRNKSPARPKDTVLVGGICQRRNHFSNSERRSCTCRPSQPEGENGNRDFIPECLWRCLARRQRQWLSPSKERRSRLARQTSGGSRSRRDGTRTEYLEYEPFRGARMVVTMHSTFKSEWRPAEMVPRDAGEVLMENKVARTYLRRADLEHWGLSEGCPGCRYLRTGKGRQQTHSEACQRRIEDLLEGDPVGSARLAAADERINRALADAVERHATKDPGVRGILKRTSVVCHLESELHKKIELDAEQDSTPRPSVS